MVFLKWGVLQAQAPAGGPALFPLKPPSEFSTQIPGLYTPNHVC